MEILSHKKLMLVVLHLALLQPLGEGLTLGEGLEVLVTLALELALEKLLPVRVPEAQREASGGGQPRCVCMFTERHAEGRAGGGQGGSGGRNYISPIAPQSQHVSAIDLCHSHAQDPLSLHLSPGVSEAISAPATPHDTNRAQ